MVGLRVCVIDRVMRGHAGSEIKEKSRKIGKALKFRKREIKMSLWVNLNEPFFKYILFLILKNSALVENSKPIGK